MEFKKLLLLSVFGILNLIGNLNCKAVLENATDAKLGFGGVSAGYGVNKIEKDTNIFYKVGMTNFVSKNVIGYDVSLTTETSLNHLSNLEKKAGEINSNPNSINFRVGPEIVLGGYSIGGGLNLNYAGFELKEDSGTGLENHSWLGVGDGIFFEVGYSLGDWGGLRLGYSSSKYPTSFGNIRGNQGYFSIEFRPN